MWQTLTKILYLGNILWFFLPVRVFAQLQVFSDSGNGGNPTLIGGIGLLTLQSLGYDVSFWQQGKIFSPLVGIISLIFAFLGMIFFGLMVYGGIHWMFSRGHEEDIEKSRKIFRDGVIGLLIILASYFIAYFVVGFAISLSVAPEEAGFSVGAWLCSNILNDTYQSIFCN